LLSAGDPYELFRDQVRIACAAGASGFLVGRALWGEAVAAPTAERAALVESTLRPRFLELASIAMEHGRDWGAGLRLPEIDTTWYQRY
jgi:tagatose 1,6-diphosphate aldolase